MPIMNNIGFKRSIRENAAQDQAKNQKSRKKINNKLDIIDQKMNGLYSDIYITRPDNRANLNNLIDGLDDSIDKLGDTDISVSGMSELIRRANGRSDKSSNKNVDNLLTSVEELFGDTNLINSLFINQDITKHIAAENYQYDMLVKYLPKLMDALEIKRDNVLSSDNFSKEFINPKSTRSTKEETIKFSSNAERLENEYNLSEFLDEMYMNMSMYGEDFIYIVPYKNALEKLMKRNQNYNINTARIGQMSFYESVSGRRTKEVVGCITESITADPDFKSAMDNYGFNENNFKEFENCRVNLHFNDTNVLLDKINESGVFISKKKLSSLKSLSESRGVSGDLSKQISEVMDKNDKLTYASSSDGLIVPDELKYNNNRIDNDMVGAILERIPRENIVPVYIGKQCLGYYYFEFRKDSNACDYCGSSHSTPGFGNTVSKNASEEQQEVAIRYIASKISTNIDAKFINANKDLKEEIYNILQYNSKFDISRSNDIGVTFLPAEDVVHGFFKQDPVTHRGISDLSRAVVPGMLYMLLYLTDIIGKITRSTDKRIYYVKQNVETNVARTMMNVVSQIKKGNMGMRQLESMNNIFNIVGKYNDYIIPMGQSGEPPIQFEVMQGQQIETPTEIMEKMEEAAVNTVMPIELVNSTMQQDFAIRYTMTNTRFLKSVNTRQRKTEKIFSNLYTKLYNYKFSENFVNIPIILPPPSYLIMNNNQQLFDNVNTNADKIIEVELFDKSEEVKSEFKRLYVRDNLSTYINFDDVNRLVELAEVNIETRKEPKAEEDSGEDMEEYM